MKIRILSDNLAQGRGILAEHGFSALINDDNLFDTGQGLALKNNIRAMGIDINNIRRIILSHGHYDHTGGLSVLMEGSSKKRELITGPGIFNEKYSVNGNIGMPFDKKVLKQNFFIKETSSPLKYSDITVSGSFPGEKNGMNGFEVIKKGKKIKDMMQDEIFVLLKGESGYYVLTGCAHKKIKWILRAALRLSGGKLIKGIIGGLHLSKVKADELKETANEMKEYGVERVFASHCSGLNAAGYFMKKGIQTKITHAGMTIKI